jgi:hypothetical protein
MPTKQHATVSRSKSCHDKSGHDMSDCPLQESIFCWSSFAKEFFNAGKDFPAEKSEYSSPEDAATKIKYEDGEIAWDTPEK